MTETKMKDEKYFSGSTLGWLIVTPSGAPLLYDGRMPMFWNRAVARLHLKPWMRKDGCRVVRASVQVRKPAPRKRSESSHVACERASQGAPQRHRPHAAKEHIRVRVNHMT